MKAKNKKNSSFTTVELIVSITIMTILGGIFLLNYNVQKDRVDLNNALSITSQEVRKAQSLVIAQSALPAECGTTGSREFFGVSFTTGNNYVSLYVDKNNNGIPDIAGNCDCATNECIERKYFSPSIQINAITPNSSNSGWIDFSRADLSVKINGGVSASALQIDFCPKSSCSSNTKRLFMNNKGLVNTE